ncbi:MerR family transcriptional regulator [Sporosarcina sp. CAU 1771]
MSQSQTNTQYTIQQVSDMTGLSKQVIRKWEERHDLVQPQRLPNGYRIYSDKDVNTLLGVKTLSEQGYSIKQAASFINKENIIESPPPERKAGYQHEQLNGHVFQLLEKGTHCDETELNLILQQAYHQLGLEKFLSTVVLPFLNEIGNRWEKGEWDEYQESVSSLIVRDFLVQIRRNYRFREDSPLLLGACLPFEMHEIPLHIVLLQFMLKGWKTILVGSSPAPGSIQALFQKLKPSMVFLSATTTTPFDKNPNLLSELDDFARNQKGVPFYLGGMGAIKYTRGKTLNSLRIVESIDDIVEPIVKL